MRDIIAEHSIHAYLKPGEIIISQNPILVSTILGSCVAITMFSTNSKVGAICHAMYPKNPMGKASNHYVDSAILSLIQKMADYGAGADVTVKLFGGAQVLGSGGKDGVGRTTIGAQNIFEAKQVLERLGLAIASANVGGSQGRKLLFSIKTGDVYLRKLRLTGNACSVGE